MGTLYLNYLNRFPHCLIMMSDDWRITATSGLEVIVKEKMLISHFIKKEI